LNCWNIITAASGSGLLLWRHGGQWPLGPTKPKWEKKSWTTNNDVTGPMNVVTRPLSFASLTHHTAWRPQH
jgi:hypothetical protein